VKLPLNTFWNQNNRSDIFGDLWSSYNLDLANKLGSLRLSPRLINSLNSSNNVSGNSTDLGIPFAARYFSAGGKSFWVGGGATGGSPNGRIYNTTAGLDGTFSGDVSANSPQDCSADQSDMEQLGSNLFVTRNSTTVSYVDSNGAWQSASGTLTNANGLHAITRFIATNRLYIVDGNATGISSISGTTITASSTYSLQSIVDGINERISWIKANSIYIFIGIIDRTGNHSRVLVWDGSQNSGVNQSYYIPDSGSLSCLIKDDVPVILTTKGRLMQLNGATFVELDRLPYDYRNPPTFFQNPTSLLCHYNGMDLVNGKINLLIRGLLYESGNPNKENIADGIWEYTKETGLYHRGSVGETKSGETITDYGQQKILKLGCLKFFEVPFSTTSNGSFVAGCEYYTDATTNIKGLFYDDTFDTLQKAGSFTTSKIFSPNITDIWQKISLRFRRFLNATDKIVIKARTIEDEPIEATITYLNTTSFTVSASSFTTAPLVGDEVEIIQGVGAGRCAHITSVSGTTTLTIVVDETITGATTQTAIARFQTWKKLGSYNSESDDFFPCPIDSSLIGSTPWIQFKVWILWTGRDELHDLIISSKANQAIE
jgi:hypothetical protein